MEIPNYTIVWMRIIVLTVVRTSVIQLQHFAFGNEQGGYLFLRRFPDCFRSTGATQLYAGYVCNGSSVVFSSSVVIPLALLSSIDVTRSPKVCPQKSGVVLR